MSLNHKEIFKIINIVKSKIASNTYPILIKKITQINNNQLYIVFYFLKKKYPFIFNIEQNYTFLGLGKPIDETPKNPYNFTLMLRKYLNNKKLICINLKENDRIFSIEFQNYLLIFELIDRNGNIFLIEKDTKKIVSSLKNRNSKLRKEYPGEIYKELPIKITNSKFEVRKEIFGYHFNPLISVYCFYYCKKLNDLINKSLKEYEKKLNKLIKIFKIIEKEYNESLKFKYYNNLGKAILTNQNFIQQQIEKLKTEKGKIKEKNIKIFDYTLNTNIEITINKTINPVQLANKYFSLSKKLKRKITEIEKRQKDLKNKIEITKENIAIFNKKKESLKCNIKNKFNEFNNIDKIVYFFKKEFQYISNYKISKSDINHLKENINIHNFKNDKFYTFILNSGKIALVGKSASNNLELLKKHAKGEDYWFHTRDFPGSYVIVKSKEISLEDIKEASTLALYFSKARNNKKADIIYTKCKYLKLIKGGKGKIIYTNDKNYFAKLDTDLINKLKSNN